MKPINPRWQMLGRIIKERLAGRSQAWLASELGVGTSHINECLAGKNRLSPRLLGEVAALLQLGPDELASLAGYEPTDVLEAYDRKRWPWTSIRELTDEVRYQVGIARLLRNQGSAREGLEHLNRYIPLLEEKVEATTGKWRTEICAVLVDALNEKMVCNTEVLSRHTVLAVTIPDFRTAYRLAKNLGDSAREAAAYTWYAGARYVARNCSESAICASRAIELSNTPVVYEEAFRILALDYGYLPDLNSFLEVEPKCLNLLEKSDSEFPGYRKAALLEGIGRGRAMLGLPDAHLWFDAAEQECKREQTAGNYRPVRLLQIHRSRLIGLIEAAKNNNRQPDKGYAEQIAGEALKLAQRHGYNRHVGEIRALASQLGLKIDLAA